MIKYFLAIFFLTFSALAGLPPTNTKLQGEVNPTTTFNFEFPRLTGTRTGVKTTFGGEIRATGVIAGGNLSINANPALFDLASVTVQFFDYTVSATNPGTTQVVCGPFTAQTVTNLATADSTYILVTPACAITQLTTFPTQAQRRANAFIGRLSHSNRTSVTVATTLPDYLIAGNSQLYDLFDAIGAFNVSGNVISPNGANLSFNKSAGSVFRRSANYTTSNQNPNVVTIAGTTPTSFIRATQTTINATPTTLVDVTNYDVGGVVTNIPGGGGTSTNRRIYLFSNGTVGIQYGQVTYASLANAIAGISTESFVVNPQAADGGILLAVLSCRRDATDISNTSQCQINKVGRFDQTGVTTGSLATTTLQQAYLNSIQPQITLNSTQLGVQVRDASTPIGSSLFAVQDNAGTTSYLGVSTTGLSTTNFVGTGTAGAVRVHNLTTAQKNALTGAAGMIVYDTTLGRFECYRTSWSACSNSLGVNTGNYTLVSNTDTLTITGLNSIYVTTTSSFYTLSTTSPFAGTDIVTGRRITVMKAAGPEALIIPVSGANPPIIGLPMNLGDFESVTYEYSGVKWFIVSKSN